jgi:hypothetical protein
MNINLDDNFKWFLESLLNEGYDGFTIDDMYGVIFTKNGKVTGIDAVNFITSNFYKAYPDLKENATYSIKDFIEGKIIDNNLEFGDKIIVDFGKNKKEGLFVKKRNDFSVVILKDGVNSLLIPNNFITKKEEK